MRKLLFSMKNSHISLLGLVLIIWLVYVSSSLQNTVETTNTDGVITTKDEKDDSEVKGTKVASADSSKGDVEEVTEDDEDAEGHHDIHHEGRLVPQGKKSKKVKKTTTTTSPPPPEALDNTNPDLVSRYFKRNLKFVPKEEAGKGKGGFTDRYLLKYNKNEADPQYPPFTYHGFYEPRKWHLIPPEYFNEEDNSLSVSDKEPTGISALKYKLAINKQSHCTDENPAPIDIITKNADEEPSFTDFSFRDFDTKFKFDMFIPEDGTDLLGVKILFDGGATIPPTVSKGSILGRELKFDTILVRFGENNRVGSEHYINGKQFGMELQFIFKATPTVSGSSVDPKRPYWDLADTVNSFAKDDVQENDDNINKQFIVLCVLVEVADSSVDITDSENNEGLIYLSQAARKFWKHYNTESYRAFQSEEAVLSLKQFLENPIKGHYYTYRGTLTFPPCLSFFRYSVFETPIVTDYKTWQNFEFIHSEFSDTGFMAGNFRPLSSIYLSKLYYDEDGVPLGYELRPYKEFREALSQNVKKSRLISEKENLDDYDYYEEGTPEFLESRRKKGRAKLNVAKCSTRSDWLISVLFTIACLFR